MSTHDSSYLIEQLLANKLSGDELDAFLAGLHNQDARQVYSDLLEVYFQELLNQQSQATQTDAPADTIP